jgi:hypothetical protein
MNTTLWGFPQGSYWCTILGFIKIKQHQVKNSILCWHFYENTGFFLAQWK